MPSDSIAVVEYRLLPGAPQYRIGSDGSVWTRFKKTGQSCFDLSGEWKRLAVYKVKPQRKSVPKGCYLTVALSRERGKSKRAQVHALVLEAFIGPRPDGMEGCHNDGNPSNCAISNLRWDTRKANSADRRLHGTDCCGEQHPLAKLNYEAVADIKANYTKGGPRSLSHFAKKYRVTVGTIHFVVRGQTWITTTKENALCQ